MDEIGSESHDDHGGDGDDRAIERNFARDLSKALRDDEIEMFYQPIVDLTTGHVSGFEALMRWEHRLLGMVPPKKFIPMVENIAELGDFSLRRAVAAASTWERIDVSDTGPFVSVNFSWSQLRGLNFLALVKECLAEFSLEPNRLMLEITAFTMMVNAEETRKLLDSLRDLGVAVALDNFGEGFSSLSQLTFVNPKVIKLSPDFLPPARGQERLLQATIAMGHKLNTTFTAVGIETREAMKILREVDCDYGQGFLFSPAVNAIIARTMVDIKYEL